MREIPDDFIPQDFGPDRCPWGCAGRLQRLEVWEEGGGVGRCRECGNEHITMPAAEGGGNLPLFEQEKIWRKL